jgi:hypothetical protein
MHDGIPTSIEMGNASLPMAMSATTITLPTLTLSASPSSTGMLTLANTGSAAAVAATTSPSSNRGAPTTLSFSSSTTTGGITLSGGTSSASRGAVTSTSSSSVALRSSATSGVATLSLTPTSNNTSSYKNRQHQHHHQSRRSIGSPTHGSGNGSVVNNAASPPSTSTGTATVTASSISVVDSSLSSASEEEPLVVASLFPSTPMPFSLADQESRSTIVAPLSLSTSTIGTTAAISSTPLTSHRGSIVSRPSTTSSQSGGGSSIPSLPRIGGGGGHSSTLSISSNDRPGSSGNTGVITVASITPPSPHLAAIVEASPSLSLPLSSAAPIVSNDHDHEPVVMGHTVEPIVPIIMAHAESPQPAGVLSAVKLVQSSSTNNDVSLGTHNEHVASPIAMVVPPVAVVVSSTIPPTSSNGLSIIRMSTKINDINTKGNRSNNNNGASITTGGEAPPISITQGYATIVPPARTGTLTLVKLGTSRSTSGSSNHPSTVTAIPTAPSTSSITIISSSSSLPKSFSLTNTSATAVIDRIMAQPEMGHTATSNSSGRLIISGSSSSSTGRPTEAPAAGSDGSQSTIANDSNEATLELVDEGHTAATSALVGAASSADTIMAASELVSRVEPTTASSTQLVSSSSSVARVQSRPSTPIITPPIMSSFDGERHNNEGAIGRHTSSPTPRSVKSSRTPLLRQQSRPAATSPLFIADELSTEATIISANDSVINNKHEAVATTTAVVGTETGIETTNVMTTDDSEVNRAIPMSDHQFGRPLTAAAATSSFRSAPVYGGISTTYTPLSSNRISTHPSNGNTNTSLPTTITSSSPTASSTSPNNNMESRVTAGPTGAHHQQSSSGLMSGNGRSLASASSFGGSGGNGGASTVAAALAGVVSSRRPTSQGNIPLPIIPSIPGSVDPGYMTMTMRNPGSISSPLNGVASQRPVSRVAGSVSGSGSGQVGLAVVNSSNGIATQRPYSRQGSRWQSQTMDMDTKRPGNLISKPMCYVIHVWLLIMSMHVNRAIDTCSSSARLDS